MNHGLVHLAGLLPCVEKLNVFVNRTCVPYCYIQAKLRSNITASTLLIHCKAPIWGVCSSKVLSLGFASPNHATKDINLQVGVFYQRLHYLVHITASHLFLALTEIFIPLVTLHIALDITVDIRAVLIGL